jgi:regulator of protease activity HflC (stomatin/prohibitin superfamily)
MALLAETLPNSIKDKKEKEMQYFNFVVWGILFTVFVLKLVRMIRIVPTKSEFIVERFGKYNRTLGAGLHFLWPFVEKVAYIQDLKEESINVPPQICFTKDNVQVEVDGVIYISVMDTRNASYGIMDYRFAATQLAMTTTRSVVGTIDLDQTFEERNLINSKVVEVLDQVSKGWGIRVHRFEVKNIVPPRSVRESMEKQMSSERERRAIIAQSEGEKQSRISRSEGLKMEMINKSEGEKQRRINEAEGKAQEIEAIAIATAESIGKIADAISQPGGKEAIRLRLSENYLVQYENLAKANTNIILPKDLANLNDILSSIGLPLVSKKEV